MNSVAVIGGGPAGLMAAETLARGGVRVTVYDRMPSPGRKFLLAGRSGLNLTHAEPFERFVARYGAAAARLRPALDAFPPDALRAWADGLGADTFAGSSGRVFPRAWKASPLLRAWLKRLDELGVSFALRHRWTGFAEGRPVFTTAEGKTITADAHATILALGGGSWPRLGSDGAWHSIVQAEGVGVNPLRPANCGLRVAWSDIFRGRFGGEPLKRIALEFGGRTVWGEAVVTGAGLEGGAVYGLSGPIRDALDRSQVVTLRIDLRPDLTLGGLTFMLARPRGKQSLSTFLRKSAGLSRVAIGLLREAAGPTPSEPDRLAALIKNAPVPITGTDTLDRAISSAGGIALGEIDDRFMLRRLPGVFAAGEMLDWDAPTGGYLLQACLATGRSAGQGALDWLKTK